MAAASIRVGRFIVTTNHMFLAVFFLLVSLSFPSAALDSPLSLLEKISSDSVKAPAISPERYRRLSKGVNFFIQNDNESWNEFGAEDVASLRHMGITHVSIAIMPAVFWKDGNFSDKTWSAPQAMKLLNKIHKTVSMLIDADMGVVLKIMPTEDEMRALYFSPDETIPRWTAFYSRWAKEFSSYSAEHVFFHTLNEPRFVLFMAAEQRASEDADNRYPPNIVTGATKSWARIEDKLVDAIRTQSFKHTIMVSGDAFAGIDGLEAHPILADSNIIYNFHYYLPLVFSHQSATWVNLPGSLISNLKYPADDENCKLQQSQHSQNAHLKRYCSGAWNRDRHEKEIGVVAAWAKKNNVYAWLGEFGTYPDKADPVSVQKYYGDIRQIAESNGIGWSAWEYANWLGRLKDENMVSALGLQVKAKEQKEQ
jgi:endoglucanase